LRVTPKDKNYILKQMLKNSLRSRSQTSVINQSHSVQLRVMRDCIDGRGELAEIACNNCKDETENTEFEDVE